MFQYLLNYQQGSTAIFKYQYRVSLNFEDWLCILGFFFSLIYNTVFGKKITHVCAHSCQDRLHTKSSNNCA